MSFVVAAAPSKPGNAAIPAAPATMNQLFACSQTPIPPAFVQENVAGVHLDSSNSNTGRNEFSVLAVLFSEGRFLNIDFSIFTIMMTSLS